MISQINSSVRSPTPTLWPFNQRIRSKGNRSERLGDTETAWVLMIKIFRYSESSNWNTVGLHLYLPRKDGL